MHVDRAQYNEKGGGRSFVIDANLMRFEYPLLFLEIAYKICGVRCNYDKIDNWRQPYSRKGAALKYKTFKSSETESNYQEEVEQEVAQFSAEDETVPDEENSDESEDEKETKANKIFMAKRFLNNLRK